MTSSGVEEYSLGVGGRNHMLLTVERTSVSATKQPTRPLGAEAEQELNITVVFTTVESTLAALKEAGSLASQLGARIVLVVPQVVPHPIPLDAPPVLVKSCENRFRVMASKSRVKTNVQIYLCRDRFDTLTSVLKPGSIVVLGGRKRWGMTKEERLGRRLQSAGYEVIFKKVA
jgi:hypothetical protein